jgi:hypothetical protein
MEHGTWIMVLFGGKGQGRLLGSPCKKTHQKHEFTRPHVLYVLLAKGKGFIELARAIGNKAFNAVSPQI